MGWKRIKEHYRIGHFVQVAEEGICIGSPYIYNIIVIDRDGKIVRGRERRGNADLQRYVMEMDADPEMLRRLMAEPDTFETSITVYTYEDGQILEKQCEALGWPNITHDGKMMHDNTYSPDRDTVIGWAKRNARLSVEAVLRTVEDAERHLEERRALLAKYSGYRDQLEADYPQTAAAT